MQASNGSRWRERVLELERAGVDLPRPRCGPRLGAREHFSREVRPGDVTRVTRPAMSEAA
ncbi:hypothetical protein D7W82_15295 [Corallococcus sp. CA049B]|nr:hypothetical protein D7W82_15295 [Corallococcus sp. CA049B]